MNIDVNNINLKKDKKINLTATAILLVSFITVIGITYAFFAINKQGTGLAANINCYTVNYTKGQDIAGELTVGADYTVGESTDIVMYADPDCELLTGTIYITTNPNTTMDLTDNALRYTVLEGTEVVAEGSVDGTTNQPIYENFILNTTETTYKVYIWLDEILEDVTSLENELYSGFIHTEVLVSSQIAEPEPDIKFASYTVNGTPSEMFPTTGSYTVDTSSCTDASVTYDYTEKAFYVYNQSAQYVSCNPTLTTTTRTPLATYIKNLLGTNTSIISESTIGNGSTLEKITNNGEEDYRYRGVNPANYIWFNNELWRIIGVFDDNSHGKTDTHLVKIIRNDSIGQYVWDNRTTVGETTTTTNGWNNFPNSDIYNILNTAYYNHIDATGEEYCYAYQTSLTGKCDFTRIGIQDDYRSMIESDVNWFLGGINHSQNTTSSCYNAERGNSKYSSNNTTTKAAGLIVPVGLMYVSDYGYAAPSTCTYTLNKYNNDGCANKNWLHSSYYNELTITHQSTSSYFVFYIGGGTGIVTNNNAHTGSNARPTIYLKSDVYYLSGIGTQTEPYIIAQ